MKHSGDGHMSKSSKRGSQTFKGAGRGRGHLLDDASNSGRFPPIDQPTREKVWSWLLFVWLQGRVPNESPKSDVAQCG